MYNIDMYKYRDKPFTQVKKYGIFPWNDSGLEKFLGPDSHNVNYLSRINPKVFREIVGMDYESIVAQQKSQIQEMKDKEVNEPEPTESKSFWAPPSLPGKQKPLSSRNEMNGNQIHENKEIEDNEMNDNHQHTWDTRNNKYHSLTPLVSPRNSQFYRSYHRQRDYKGTYGYHKSENIRTNKDQYLKDINNWKNNQLVNDNFNYTHSGNFYPKKRYKGFTSYAVPRTSQALDKLPSHAFQRFNNTLAKSLNCFNTKNPSENEFDALHKDNEIMREDLMYQTNQGFLRSNKLPDVAHIANTRKHIRNIRLGNCKEMGEKYNPFAHIIDPPNRVKRNFTGALFLH